MEMLMSAFNQSFLFLNPLPFFAFAFPLISLCFFSFLFLFNIFLAFNFLPCVKKRAGDKLHFSES